MKSVIKQIDLVLMIVLVVSILLGLTLMELGMKNFRRISFYLLQYPQPFFWRPIELNSLGKIKFGKHFCQFFYSR